MDRKFGDQPVRVCTAADQFVDRLAHPDVGVVASGDRLCAGRAEPGLFGPVGSGFSPLEEVFDLAAGRVDRAAQGGGPRVGVGALFGHDLRRAGRDAAVAPSGSAVTEVGAGRAGVFDAA